MAEKTTEELEYELEAVVAALLLLFTIREQKIKDIVSMDLHPAEKDAKIRTVLRSIEREIVVLERSIDAASKKLATAAYAVGEKQTLEAFRLQGVKKAPRTATAEKAAAIAAIAALIANDVSTALLSARLTVTRLVRLQQQERVRAKVVEKAIKDGVLLGTARAAVRSEILQDLTRKVVTGNVVAIRGKDGIVRNYNLSSYTELVARTKAQEAISIAAINATVAAGSDLVRVSLHPHIDRPSDDCPLYAGKVFSVSGTHARFPPLKRWSPFHPNCRHFMVPIVESVLLASGGYEEAVAFSNAQGDAVA